MSNVASSGEVSIDDMLPELLRSVFEILASLGDQYRAEAPLVAPCMLVCRRWKDIAEPVVYSQVKIHSPEIAQQFASVLRSSILQGKTPAIHIRRLIMILSSYEMTDSVSSDISAVLMEARHLQTLTVWFGGGLQLALVIGARTFSASLTQLDIYVQFAHMPTVLTYVGLFSHLRSLTITFMQEDQRDGLPLAIQTEIMWNLPHLRNLNMSVMGLSSMPSPFVDFMRTCNFPVVDTVEVNMMVGSVAEAQLLSQFLLGLPPLRSLSLMVPIAEYQRIIWPCIRAASFEAWMVTELQDDFITHLLPPVTELHIQDACRDLDAVYSFFDRLLQTQDVNIKDIYLEDWFRNPEHHNWIINHRDQVDLLEPVRRRYHGDMIAPLIGQEPMGFCVAIVGDV